MKPGHATHAFAALAILACAAGAARAGSLVVRDGRSTWTVNEDADANGFVLRHLVGGNKLDEHFGRDGQATFTLGAGNEPPASVRVDSSLRVWMVGAGVAGSQPQPVVVRFLADGSPDPRWGVQGKLQLTPAGVAVRPTDLLPLSDGSVLVAGEATNGVAPRAVVFHLDAQGALDRRFGNDGLWQRPGDAESSIATSLVASADGLVAAAVATRGAKPGAELWTMTQVAPALVYGVPLDAGADPENLRIVWTRDHWEFANGDLATRVVAAASLAGHAQAPAASAAASDPGQGGFNPFMDTAASAPAAAPAQDGLPWTSIAVAIVLLASAVGAFAMRTRKPATVLRKPTDY